MKSLYSLILSSDVVQAVDALAKERGYNRSAMINEILADYVSMVTPETHVKNMFGEIEQLIGDYFDSFDNLGRAVEMKRALDVKYKPKITYELELSDVKGIKIGMLKMQWRTQHEGVVNCITQFVKNWAEAEKEVLPPEIYKYIEYTLEDGKFTRNFVVLGELNDARVCEGISGYVKNFDKNLNCCLSGKMKSVREMQDDYRRYISDGGFVI